MTPLRRVRQLSEASPASGLPEHRVAAVDELFRDGIVNCMTLYELSAPLEVLSYIEEGVISDLGIGKGIG